MSEIVTGTAGSEPRNAAPDPPSKRYAWFIVGALCLAYMMSMFDRFLISITLEPIKSELQLTDTQLGLVAGPAFGLFYAIFGLPLGRLADKVNRCRLIGAGMLAWSVATASVAFADSFGFLFASRAFVAVGEAVLMPAGAALIGAYFVREQQGRAISVFVAGSSIGKTAAFIGGGAFLAAITAVGGLQLLGHHFSPWQVLFLFAALPGLVLGALFFFLRDPGSSARDRGGSRLADVFAHLRTRKAAYGFHTGYMTCVILVNSVFVTWAASFYVRRFGLEPATAALLTGLATLFVGPLSSWIGGLTADKLWRRGVLSAPCWIAAVCSVLMVPAVLLFALSDTVAMSVIGYGLALGTSLIVVSPGLAGVNALTPPSHRGIVVGMYLFVISTVSLGMGPFLAGLANDRLFQGGSLGSSMLTLTGFFCALSVTLAFIAMRPFVKAARALET